VCTHTFIKVGHHLHYLLPKKKKKELRVTKEKDPGVCVWMGLIAASSSHDPAAAAAGSRGYVYWNVSRETFLL
jgi:hypothetical protein